MESGTSLTPLNVLSTALLPSVSTVAVRLLDMVWRPLDISFVVPLARLQQVQRASSITYIDTETEQQAQLVKPSPGRPRVTMILRRMLRPQRSRYALPAKKSSLTYLSTHRPMRGSVRSKRGLTTTPSWRCSALGASSSAEHLRALCSLVHNGEQRRAQKSTSPGGISGETGMPHRFLRFSPSIRLCCR